MSTPPLVMNRYGESNELQGVGVEVGEERCHSLFPHSGFSSLSSRFNPPIRPQGSLCLANRDGGASGRRRRWSAVSGAGILNTVATGRVPGPG